jgi:phosphatidylserine/phosphatidylglycerophosphate/cardiolipin synthase-like enzyme
MDEVIALPDDVGYVHMSFWLCDPLTVLDAAGTRFIDQIAALGAAGKEVKLLLWDPVGVQGGFVGGVQRTNRGCKQQIDALGHPSVEVQLLPFPTPFGSFHEKLMIFNTGELVKVIVGGLNIHPTYRDAAPHNGAWHDAAVQVTGPATVEVEVQWDTRWALTPGAPPSGPTLGVPGVGTQAVFPAVTDLGKAAIRDEYIARIQSARSYVYMENYGIFDPDLITALAQQIKFNKDRGRPFQVILLVPHPDLSAKYYWLHYVTHAHLSFMSCTSFTYDDGGVIRTVSRARDGRTTWNFDYDGGTFGIGNWYEDSTVSWDSDSTEIVNIRGFTGGTDLYSLELCAGAGTPSPLRHIYVHSKLALFDDVFAAVGSANFTPRSMRQDGELTAFIHGSSVPPARAQLWAEYFTGVVATPPTWSALAAANDAARRAGRLTPAQLCVLPINFFPPPAVPAGMDAWLGADQR